MFNKLSAAAMAEIKLSAIAGPAVLYDFERAAMLALFLLIRKRIVKPVPDFKLNKIPITLIKLLLDQK